MKLVTNDGKILDLTETRVMGILNVTPDSFFDGGLYNSLSKAINHVSKMIDDGATLIDIGGESTRPKSHVIHEEEEANRVLPVLRSILDRFDVFVSVNTSSALVIKESSNLGVHLINDIRSLNSKESMLAAVQSNLPVCLTHMKGSPQTMQNFPDYHNVVHEVSNFFSKQIKRCEQSGINRNKLLLDPGFGFGKNLMHNYQLLSNLRHFHHFKLPLLIGVSRKSMLNISRWTSSSKNRLIGSITCSVLASLQGVQIIRVHDVKETVEALQVVRLFQKFNRNTYLYESG